MAIYQLLVTAGNTLLQGLLGPEDVQACFETLGSGAGFDAEKLQVRSCATRSSALRSNMTCLVRNSAGSILHGWNRRRRSEGTSQRPQRLNGVGWKEGRV